MRKIIVDEYGEDVYKFLIEHVNICSKGTSVFSTSEVFNIESLPEEQYSAIVNLKKINYTRRINKFFEAVNAKLPNKGIFISCIETKDLRMMRLKKQYAPILRPIIFLLDFIIHRLLPKLPVTKQIYFFITKGHNRVISRAEFLGRLYSCGFKVNKEVRIKHLLFVVAEKQKEPAFDLNPSYGMLFKMRRVGKNGKIIQVYKFRTMHPYAEYLQDYILKLHGYSEKGKPAHDFRLTEWGKFLRKYWLDELPQLINVLKGEMKIVGVRPLSQRFLNEYPEDIKQLRLKHKPGCVPPYVALLKQDVEEYIESERIYLMDYQKHPYTTNTKYFFKAIYNILTNKIRSS